MNRLMSAAFAIVIGIVLGIPDADAAKRIGGGRSSGIKRDAVQQQQAAPSKPAQAPQAAPGATQTAPAASGAGRWLGPVAGLLAGGLLGALFFGGAFEGFKFMDFAMILLLAGAILFVYRMLRRPPPAEERAEPMRYAGVGADPRIEPSIARPQPADASAPAAGEQPPANYLPAGFDPEAFTAQAKRNFVRLQEAHDRGDLGALRDVMTAELYKEIEAQFRERGGAAQKVEVVTLDASVIEVVSEGADYIASVRFTGTIKEDDGQPEQFTEIWHLQKPRSGSSGWLLAGIQQQD